MLTDFTVSTLLEFANAYLSRDECENTEMLFLVRLSHVQFVVRHEHRRIFLFVSLSLLLVIVLTK